MEEEAAALERLDLEDSNGMNLKMAKIERKYAANPDRKFHLEAAEKLVDQVVAMIMDA